MIKKSINNKKFFFYNIHNLVHIRVEASVSKLILKQLNFQIGAFEINKLKKKNKIPTIVIKSFTMIKNFKKNNTQRLIFHKHTHSQ